MDKKKSSLRKVRRWQNINYDFKFSTEERRFYFSVVSLRTWQSLQVKQRIRMVLFSIYTENKIKSCNSALLLLNFFCCKFIQLKILHNMQKKARENPKNEKPTIGELWILRRRICDCFSTRLLILSLTFFWLSARVNSDFWILLEIVTQVGRNFRRFFLLLFPLSPRK